MRFPRTIVWKRSSNSHFGVNLALHARSCIVASQSIMLGAIFVAIAAFTDSIYAYAASRIAPLFARAKNASAVGRYLSGLTYIGMGVLAALSSQRATKN